MPIIDVSLASVDSLRMLRCQRLSPPVRMLIQSLTCTVKILLQSRPKVTLPDSEVLHVAVLPDTTAHASENFSTSVVPVSATSRQRGVSPTKQRPSYPAAPHFPEPRYAVVESSRVHQARSRLATLHSASIGLLCNIEDASLGVSDSNTGFLRVFE